jgi:Apea-like HEPN
MSDRQSPVFQTVDLREFSRFVPTAWFGAKRSILIACYQTLRIPAPNPGRQIFTVLSLRNVVGFAFDGSIGYWEPSGGRMSATPGLGLQVHMGQAVARESPIGTWLILLTPQYGEDPDRRLTEAAAHCALVYGRVMLHHRLARMAVVTEDAAKPEAHTVQLIYGPYNAFGSYLAAQPPLAALASDFDPYRHAFEQLSDACEKRVRLALCWYERSIHTSSRIEAFLNLWIGLEVIVKCRSSVHGAPGVNNLLQRHYSLASQDEVDAEFHVQSLYDRRNEMVHGGDFDEVCPFAVDFTGLLFRDIVRETLGLALRGYAREALGRSSAGAIDWSTLRFRDGHVPTTGPDMDITCVESVNFGGATAS